MECNIFCSGSRRSLYTKNDLPSIGCNIPYEKVDYIFILEPNIIDYYEENLHLLQNQKVIIRNDLSSYIKNKPIKKYIELSVSAVNSSSSTKYRSSGHYAALFMIFKGFLKLNIYGCNSWFDTEDHLISYTDNFVQKPKFLNPNNGKLWKLEWEKMINFHKSIEFNFI